MNIFWTTVPSYVIADMTFPEKPATLPCLPTLPRGSIDFETVIKELKGDHQSDNASGTTSPNSSCQSPVSVDSRSSRQSHNRPSKMTRQQSGFFPHHPNGTTYRWHNGSTTRHTPPKSFHANLQRQNSFSPKRHNFAKVESCLDCRMKMTTLRRTNSLVGRSVDTNSRMLRLEQIVEVAH